MLRPPRNLNASGLACFWSIQHLIETWRHVYLWTFTLPTLKPDYYISACRRRFFITLNDSVRNGTIPKYGGVRVVEVHPGGHGLHDHMPLSFNRRLHGNHCSLERRIREAAHDAGYGVIHRHPKPATPYAAIYLAQYLNEEGGTLHKHAKRWANFGAYRGCKVKDIIYESESIDILRRGYEDARKSGLAPWPAIQAARRVQADWLSSHATNQLYVKNPKYISSGKSGNGVELGSPQAAAIIQAHFRAERAAVG